MSVEAGLALRFLAAALLAGMQQLPGADSAAVEGVVANKTSGAPVKKALVTLRSAEENSGYQALSAADGRFRIGNIAAGEYEVWVEAQGFVRQAGPSAALSIELAEGQNRKDLAIRLVPLGAISGRVLDENGDPVAGVTLEARHYSYSRSSKILRSGGRGTTDSRGEYRVFDLPPDRWYLEAKKTPAELTATGRVHSALPAEVYGDTFFPNAARAAETAGIELAPGADVGRIDIRLRRTRLFTIRGKVLDARTSEPAGGAQLDIGECAPEEDGGYLVNALRTGAFAITEMPPGRYCIVATAPGDPPLYSTLREVVVADRDVDDVVLRVEPTSTLRGVALIEGGPLEKLKSGYVILDPIGGAASSASAPIGADGSFLLASVPPQAYRVRANRTAPGVYLKSVRFGPQDASEDGLIVVAPGGGGLSVVFGADTGAVEGTVETGGAAIGSLRVTLAPEGRYARREDLIQTVEVESPGARFRLDNVAPGDYRIFAWGVPDEEFIEYPGLRQLFESKAVSITVGAGERKTVQADLISADEIEEARRKLR
ncbi:MAG: carboxypeptidase-like regulatory domain-containing protein [Acidobacteriia bacterium]|nr:carboxypeptidase-like regulatory domain-containing protein [Terriglobia bacterium]